MAENRFSCNSSIGNSSVRETVCIETNRILDSCRDRDCYENVKVFLTDFGNEIIQHTSNIRTKSACISSANITLDPVQFNKGFYTVTIRFYIKLCFEACVGGGRSQEFEGIAVVEKKVVLYGSESNVSVFKSTSNPNDFCSVPDPVCCIKNTPCAVVEVVEPIILNTLILEHKVINNCCCCCCAAEIPESVSYKIDGILCDDPHNGDRYLVVSLGIFSIVRIVRPAQYLINASEYTIPDKECIMGTDSDPCKLFKSMAFPISEFNPPSISSGSIEKRCGS